MTGSESNIYTVTQVNEYIKAMLDAAPALCALTVKGEISNFTNHRTGHYYFTLKDEGSRLPAVMFKSAAAKLKFIPENGMRVIMTGRISSFVRDGQYQLYAESMEPDGVGALYIAYEQLKRRLEAEGLFRQERKKPLPKIPTRIGIITSPTGAAVRDIINIAGRRFPFAELVLFPALVQGDGAVANLIAGLEYFDKTKRVDVIIIGRGGGSIEDLWAFNDEGLARAVAASAIPVISAVGHETDFTICDFAADRRAPTPSAAAELAVPDTAELKRKIGNITGRLELMLSMKIETGRKTVKSLSERRVLKVPSYMVDERRMALMSADNRLGAAQKLLLTKKHADFVRLTASLEAINPMSVITRGYSAVFREDGVLVKSVTQISEGDVVNFRLTDGDVAAKVKKTYPAKAAAEKIKQIK